MRILYVEDNPANLFLVQRVARMGNHEVINYMDGEVALKCFDHDHPDLVLMDIQIPGKLNGLDVVKKLREAGYKTPIIAVTAYAMLGDREKCIEAGCDSYMAKPIPIDDLVEVFKRYDPLLSQTQEVVTSPAPAAPTPAVEVTTVALPDNATPTINEVVTMPIVPAEEKQPEPETDKQIQPTAQDVKS